MKVQAVCVAHSESRFTTLLDSTKIVVFLGTPHRGSDYAKKVRDIIKITEGISRASLLPQLLGRGLQKNTIGYLEPHSPYLTELSDSFVERAQDIKIVSFYETCAPKRLGHRVRIVCCIKCKMYKLTKIKVVEEDSAKMQIPREEFNPLDFDHMSMCKVDSEEESLNHFLAILEPMRRQIKASLGRFILR
jgi:hypothetical protein